MPKTFITDSDIEIQAQLGNQKIFLDENTIITDLAFEKAKTLGIELIKQDGYTPPSAPIRPYINQTLQAAIKNEAQTLVNDPLQSIKNNDVLKFSQDSDENSLRTAIIETGQILYKQGLMVSNDGNISARLPDGNVLITPSGFGKGRISEDDLLVIDLDGQVVKPAKNPALKPTSEKPMHLEVYKQRPDVFAVIHTHLIYANALAISHGKIRMDVIPEAAIAFGEIPITEFSLPSTSQNAEVIQTLIKDHDVMLIRNHGSLAVGKDLDDALIKTERLEHVSKTLTFAELLGEPNKLPQEMLDAIAEIIKNSRK